MPNRLPLIDSDGEVRELLDADFAAAKRLDSLPESVQKTLRGLGKRGSQRAPTKELVTIRLSRDVVDHFRGAGRGWQTRIDEALKKAVKTGIA
ncbi:BrnA antitoxin family protein [Allopusillimonas ginsengisoli]|uniref:BrnA antitoxin family protein n=1 Tax=Allopusillimonas ginsengisoli TaxID=453575 RepID=UPI00101F3E31|nr:BrnA antitoxin family protein [Allopusillimonas ginsengisoli]TEA79916.1 hypothetical protein ERE07_02970 [Allopusillimonas ginsengisoli]